jgi:uncharacterized protein
LPGWPGKLAAQHRIDFASMPHAKPNRSSKLDPRGPLVFDVKTLGSASARREQRVVPAPAALGAGLVRVPEGAQLQLDVQLEDVTEGVLVTAEVSAPLAGECARCLDEFTSSMRVRFQELFTPAGGSKSSSPRAETDGSGDDGYIFDGDLLDLESALRDALVLDLPLSPLCDADCPGLCSTCGIRLADAEPDHGHPADTGVWAVLRDLFPAEAAGENVGTTGPAGSKEQ